MRRSALIAIVTLATVCAWCQKESGKKETKTIPYLKLSTPRHVLPTAQSWEGNEFPHTMSVLEMKRGGYRYWGWYGLNEGRGIGLARSNDLLNWTKYEQNPLWTNARWPRSWPKRIPRIKVFCTSPSRGITTHRAATSFWRVRATGFILMRKRCWYTASLTSATRTRICFAIPAPGVSISRFIEATTVTISRSSVRALALSWTWIRHPKRCC